MGLDFGGNRESVVVSSTYSRVRTAAVEWLGDLSGQERVMGSIPGTAPVSLS